MSTDKNTNVVAVSRFFKFGFVALWLACLVSAFGVIHSTFTTREAVRNLESLRRVAIDLKVESGKYQLERSTLGAFSRVESIATESLRMSAPQPVKTVLVVRE